MSLSDALKRNLRERMGLHTGIEQRINADTERRSRVREYVQKHETKREGEMILREKYVNRPKRLQAAKKASKGESFEKRIEAITGGGPTGGGMRGLEEFEKKTGGTVGLAAYEKKLKGLI